MLSVVMVSTVVTPELEIKAVTGANRVFTVQMQKKKKDLPKLVKKSGKSAWQEY